MNKLTRAVGLLLLVLLWEAGARIAAAPMLIPASAALEALARLTLSGSLLEHAGASLLRVCLGFVIAAVVGVGAGIAMVRFRAVAFALTPLVDAMRPVAALTIFPLIILLFGLGLWGKVFVIFWTAWPACLINTVQGLRAVDAAVLEAARLDGASENQLLAAVTFPLAVPTIVTGLRIGLSGGWISVVAAEMLGAKSGLGWAVMAYSNTFHFPEMYAAILTIALVGLLMNTGLNAMQHALDPLAETGDVVARPATFDFRALFDWRSK